MGKVGCPHKEKEPKGEKARCQKSGSPFTAVPGWPPVPLTMGAGEGTHMTVWTVPRVTAPGYPSLRVEHWCAKGSLDLWVEKEQLTLLVKLEGITFCF